MRANGLMLPVTPAEGITGPIQYARMGRMQDYGSRPPTGAIVVLDYNAGKAWMDAFRMGAKAVVFVRNGPTPSWAAHSIENHANFPRFYYSGPASDLPDGERATIHSDLVLGRRHRLQRLRFSQRNRADVRPQERGMPDPGGESR